jgi:hypothetical protein
VHKIRFTNPLPLSKKLKNGLYLCVDLRPGLNEQVDNLDITLGSCHMQRCGTGLVMRYVTENT